MQITEIKAKQKLPIQSFEVSNLSSVVVLAGPNGIGKTRLIQQIIALFQNPHADETISLRIESTSQDERKMWGKNSLSTLDGNDSQTLHQHLRRNRRRGKWTSSIINFDSSRTFETVKPFQWSWDFPDPFEEVVSWNLLLNPFKGRFQDTIHALYKKNCAL